MIIDQSVEDITRNDDQLYTYLKTLGLQEHEIRLEIQNINQIPDYFDKYLSFLDKEKSPRIFVNRDVNASKNILYLGRTYLESQQRPEIFSRKKKDKDVK